MMLNGFEGRYGKFRFVRDTVQGRMQPNLAFERPSKRGGDRQLVTATLAI